jgi:hypothetical protein
MKTILILSFFTFALLAQTNEPPGTKPKPDRWRGLILGESSPNDAIARLGKPESDKVDSLKIYVIGKWFTDDHKKKLYRKLVFQEVETVKKVELSFKDEKLVMIELHFDKKFSPHSLGNNYSIAFKPIFGGLFSGSEARSKQGLNQPINYPPAYSLVGKSEKSVLFANVSNVTGSVFKDVAGVNDTEDTFPGKVDRLQIISRTLENNDGADALK